jgi:hypothetical protein
MSTNGQGQNGHRRNGLKPNPHVIFTTPGLIDAAMQKAARQAVRRHKLLGESIAVWRDGKVVIVPPEEIEVPELPGDDAQA